MNAQPQRRAALQRPSVPDHPFAAPVPADPTAPFDNRESTVVSEAPVPAAAPHQLPERTSGPRSRKSLAGQATTITFASRGEYDRIKLAFEAQGIREGFRSLNDFMVDAVVAAVEELETRHNNGQPFTTADIRSRRRR